MQNSPMDSGRLLKLLLLSLLAAITFIAFTYSASAASRDYTIDVSDTPASIDNGATTANVDTTNREITLPQAPAPDIVSFWGSGEVDYAVLTTSGIKHYSYDGASVIENGILNVTGLTNPLALAAPDPFPDVVTADAGGIRHYSFSGSNMVENPALSVAGLTGVAAIGTAGVNELAILSNNQVEHYSFDGTSMLRNTFLEPATALSNPIDIALTSGGYDIAVLEPNRARFFNFNGAGLSENPVLAVTGLTAPKGFAIADPNGGYDLAVVDGNQVKHYSFTGSSMAYNTALSVTSGLTSPRAVAIRPGSYDRIIVDGNQVKYYQWNGSSLVYNSNLSVTVADIVQGAGYATYAVVQSLAFDPGTETEYVRVRAVQELPNKTSVTWSVTADGTTWTKKWRVRGIAGGTICEITPDNGTSWTSIGNASVAMPGIDNAQLWNKVVSGRAVKWRAELTTTDATVTPRIATSPRGGIAVKVDTNASPDQPGVISDDTCYGTTTPTLTWLFADPDDGDTQSAFQIEIFRASDLTLVLDSGKVISSSSQYVVPTSDTPDAAGPLWNSGDYQFKIRVMVWDQADVPSFWSSYGDFCVVAFERPRIVEIVSPPVGQSMPVLISKGMTRGQLPKVKAGAKVVMLVDSVGPLTNISPVFPYLSNSATVNIPEVLPDAVTNNPMLSMGNPVNRWAIEFWTDANLSVCPDGTLIQMMLSGSSGAGAAILNAPPYADGVAVTEGSVYGDWFVVNQGRD